MSASDESHPGHGLRDALVHDHEQIAPMFDAVLDRLHVGDVPAIDEAWTKLERALLAHLDAEEMFILPALARMDPARATVIRAEHADIREKLAECGVALELHSMSEERLTTLRDELRAHSQAEEKDYKWAEGELPKPVAGSLLRRLRDAWTRRLKSVTDVSTGL
jgi:hypothetical protein